MAKGVKHPSRVLVGHVICIPGFQTLIESIEGLEYLYLPLPILMLGITSIGQGAMIEDQLTAIEIAVLTIILSKLYAPMKL